MATQPPVILLVYANDRVDPAKHLRNLSSEINRIRDVLRPAEQRGICQVEIEANASADRIFSIFQTADYRDRITIFHYAGHADGDQLLLESPTGERGIAHAEGLASFLGTRTREGLQLALVFLNGCSTAAQVQGLLDADCQAVIATSAAVDDEVAMDFAVQFYQGLAGNAGLESAFAGAGAAIKTRCGKDPRALYWGDAAALAGRDPWELSIRCGSDEVRYWNLPKAADDPLSGLPALPRLDLPDSPFRHLEWFARKHAEVFFGRDYQIRALYDRITAANAPPILLYYGESGVGKSSVLAAGLLPRLESSHRVDYLRRDQRLGLLGTLMQPLAPETPTPAAAWHQAEAAARAPLLLVLDQIEEVFTRPTTDQVGELGSFLDGLESIFGQVETRPRGRLILSFRKEWLPELEQRLAERQLPRGRLFLEGLDRRGIIAAVNGCTRSERLRIAFGLRVDAELAEEIADDLLADLESPIAPTLQILLTKLWSEAKRLNDAQPTFTRKLYLGLKREGILLRDFLDQQLAVLQQWRPPVIESGLALDLLAAHTTFRGTATECIAHDLLTTYAHVQASVIELAQHCKDGYLLADIPTTQLAPVKGSRLAHDALAPLVRERFEKSERPGQRARRILESRVVEWQEGKSGAALDAVDLAVVEVGVSGMRSTTAAESRLITQSRRARERQRVVRARWRAVGAAGVLTVVLTALFGAWQWQQAKRQARIAIAQLQVLQASTVRNSDPQLALLLAAEAVRRPLDTDHVRLGAPETLLRDLLASTGGFPLRGHQGVVKALAFDPRGRWLATAGSDETVRLWDLQQPETKSRVLRGCAGDLDSLAFDPQGRRLAATSNSKDTDFAIPCIWDLDRPGANPILLEGEVGDGRTLPFDPQGRWFATISDRDPTTVSVSDLDHPEAKPIVLAGHADGVRTLAFAPQGRWFVTSGNGQTPTRLWDLNRPEARPIVLRADGDGFSALAFDPRGRWLVGANDNILNLWDMDNPEAKPTQLREGDLTVASLAFDPGGRWLVTGSHEASGYVGATTAHLWDLERKKTKPYVLTWPEGNQRAAEGGTKFLTFDPKGRWLALASEAHTAARLWDLEHLEVDKPVVLDGKECGVAELAFDPQGHWLATSCGNTARLWDLDEPGTEPRVLRGQESYIEYLGFDPQGRWLATASQLEGDSPRLWKIEHPQGEPRVLYENDYGVRQLGFDAHGRLAIAIHRALYVQNLDDPQAKPVLLGGAPDEINAPAFDPRGRWLAAGSRAQVHLLSLNDLSAAPVLLTAAPGTIRVIAFDPRGRRLAAGSEGDTSARVWDLDDLKAAPVLLAGHPGGVTLLAFDPEGRWLTTGSAGDSQLRLWDLDHPEAQPVLLGEYPDVIALAFTPRGRWLATNSDGTVLVRDLNHPKTEPMALRGEPGRTWAVFDPQGRWLATTTSMVSLVRLWDLDRRGVEAVELGGHELGASLAFDPRGRWLATATSSGTKPPSVRLWQLDIGPLLDLACRTAGRNLTAQEWSRYMGDIAYQITCPNFGVGRTVAAEPDFAAP